MPKYQRYSLLLLLFLVPRASVAEVKLTLKGLSGEAESNVNALLSGVANDSGKVDSDLKRSIIDTVKKGLKAKGYYQPKITFTEKKQLITGKPLLVINVDAGEPILIEGTTINLTGAAREDRSYQRLLKRDLVKKGDILDHGKYESFKSSLTSLAIRKGYFDAEMTKSQLGVAEQLHQAFWDIDFNSGERYRFGQVTFLDSQIKNKYLVSLIPFKEGDYYSSDQLAELNRRLSATGWFNSVVAAPSFNKIGENKTLPLDVSLSPRTKNSVEVGLGYSTDIGPRFKSNWKKPWLNSSGHSLEASTGISAPEQSLDFNYKIPLEKNALDHYYLLQSGFKREDQNDTKANSMTVNVARYWNFSNSWQRSVNLRWSLDSFTQGSEEKTSTMLLYPGVNVNRTRQKGGLMPYWGDTQRYSIDYSNTVWGSDVGFAVFQAQNVWIRTYARKHRFVARGAFGWIETGDFSRVPPSLRFFAGGDRSIRGYKYKDISPKDDQDKLTGASKLVTGSLEYQYNVTSKWWGAMFVDSGEAVHDFSRDALKTGVGVGVRWVSPIGPIKLDVARPIGDSDKRGMQFYIAIGPEL